jgi:Periplasmic copper-binding protein (NosD)
MLYLDTLDGELFEWQNELSDQYHSQALETVKLLTWSSLQNTPKLYQAAFEHLNQRLSALQGVLAGVTLTHEAEVSSLNVAQDTLFRIDLSKQLEPLIFENKSNFILDFQNLPFSFERGAAPKFLISIQNCRNFIIKNAHVSGCRNFCIIVESSDFEICNSRITRCEGYGIIVHHSSYFVIHDCAFEANLASGLFCNGNSHHASIFRNSFTESQGYYNWDAGLHINHCSSNIKIEHLPELSHEPISIIGKACKPRFIFVRNNLFFNNKSQGIYCEGCLLSVFKDNVISNNNKEGICFDWGSSLNWFENNEVSGNGKRNIFSQEEIAADFIQDFPLLEDGSSSCKLPGVSLDNGSLNYIVGNRLHHNYGGGIKFVRSSLINLIYKNFFNDNGLGVNEFFKAYHAIILLGMGAVQDEFEDGKATLLDFLPSYGNIFSKNLFNGNSHHHSIYADGICSANLIREDNVFLHSSATPLSENLLLKRTRL